MSNGGASQSPGVRSTGVPPPVGTFQTCVRGPSFHESQWRNRSRSATRAFVGDFARAFTRASRQATSAQSEKTSEVMTNHLPSGDHPKPLTSVGKEVAFDGSPPERSTVQICQEPSRFERKATRRPSGEKSGSESRFSPEDRRRGVPPATGASQIDDFVRFSDTTGVPIAYAIHLPSGERSKPPIRSDGQNQKNCGGNRPDANGSHAASRRILCPCSAMIFGPGATQPQSRRD